MRAEDVIWLSEHPQPECDTYADYMNTSWWARMRSERMYIDCGQCACCLADGPLELHHIQYPGWFEEDINTDVVMLCRRCHEFVTSIQKDDTPMPNFENACELATAILGALQDKQDQYLTNYLEAQLRRQKITVPGSCSCTAARVLAGAVAHRKKDVSYVGRRPINKESQHAKITQMLKRMRGGG